MVPAPITATRCTDMEISSSKALEEGANLATGEVWLLVMHEMARIGHRRQLHIREILAQPIRPFALEDRIAFAPQYARRQLYRRKLRLWRLAAHRRQTCLVGADVPVEAALEIAGLEEI